MSVEVINETGEPVDGVDVAAIVTFVLHQMHVSPFVDVNVLFVDEASMERYHVEWMDEPGATDVLSFPMDELRPGTAVVESGPGQLGDIVVCPAVAIRQAEQAGHDVSTEYRILVTHAVLHLLGYDHAEPDEAAEMFGLQRDLVAAYVTHTAAEAGR